MNKNILRILAHILREIKSSSFDDIDMQMITESLVERGFSEEEVLRAISWLNEDEEDDFHPIDEGRRIEMPRPLWRQLNELEQDVISPSAFSYLFHLRELDVVADNEMERIIDRATKLDLPQIGVEDMQDLIAVVLLDFEKNASDGFFQFTANHSPH